MSAYTRPGNRLWLARMRESHHWTKRYREWWRAREAERLRNLSFFGRVFEALAAVMFHKIGVGDGE